MGKYRKKVQVVVLLAVLIIGGYAIFQSFQNNDSNNLIKVGQPAPDFRLANLNNEAVALSDYIGTPLVINFWGTFCEPCIREIPSFQNQYEKWNEQGLEIVGINLSEDSLTVSNYVRKFNMTYAVVRDVDRKTEKKYGLRSYPTTFFVNADGTLQAAVVGEMTEKQIEEHIQQIMQ